MSARRLAVCCVASQTFCRGAGRGGVYRDARGFWSSLSFFHKTLHQPSARNQATDQTTVAAVVVIKVLLRKRGQSALPVRDHMSPAKVTPNRQSARCVHSRILKQTHPHKITAGTPVIFHEDAHRLSSPQAFTAALRLSSLRLVCFAKYECLIHTPVTQHQDTLSPFMAATTRKGPALSGFRHATPRSRPHGAVPVDQ